MSSTWITESKTISKNCSEKNVCHFGQDHTHEIYIKHYTTTTTKVSTKRFEPPILYLNVRILFARCIIFF
jgi:hypothetical protein